MPARKGATEVSRSTDWAIDQRNAQVAQKRARLQTLKPRVQTLATSRIQTAPKPSQQPNYRIRGRELQRIRAEHFRRNPLCVRCMEQGKVTLAVELDHIVALTNGGKDVEENRQGLCNPCHQAKTAEDLKG